jgi:hypothetical protein
MIRHSLIIPSPRGVAISLLILTPSRKPGAGGDQPTQDVLLADDIDLETNAKRGKGLRQKEDHFPATIRREYIISNGWGPTLISPRNGLSHAPNK